MSLRSFALTAAAVLFAVPSAAQQSDLPAREAFSLAQVLSAPFASGLVAAPDGRRTARADEDGSAADPEALGARVAELLRGRGALEILQALQQ